MKHIPLWLIFLFSVSLIAAGFVIGSYFYWFKSISLMPLEQTVAKAIWGQFGDYIGGILNPLFSFTALCALLYTIKLQSKELHESTEQLKSSAQALALQNDVLMRQQFEHTFFQLFEMFNKLVDSILLTPINIKLYGKEGINELYWKHLHPTMYANSRDDGKVEINVIENIKQYLYVFKAIVEFSAYFRTLYSIIKFVDNSQLPFEDKKFYTNLVRAQLTDAELGLLFYNCLCLPKYEQSKFIPLIIRYDLLEYLQDETLANPQHRQLWDTLIANYQNQ
ncbi:MAG: putative phage abortive infection protein [Methylococcaceae bacterium]